MFTWIYRIAVNTGINYLRKQKVKNYLGLENIDLRADEEKKDLSLETKSILQKAIKKLPVKQQMVIILRSLQEMSYKDVAQIMNISVNSAKVNYSHALKNLKEKLEKMGVNYESL